MEVINVKYCSVVSASIFKVDFLACTEDGGTRLSKAVIFVYQLTGHHVPGTLCASVPILQAQQHKGSITNSLTNMCSANQPSLSAIVEPIRRAKHFFPSSELPPYPLPYETISFFSGL